MSILEPSAAFALVDGFAAMTMGAASAAAGAAPVSTVAQQVIGR
jgi:hypothetical protein